MGNARPGLLVHQGEGFVATRAPTAPLISVFRCSGHVFPTMPFLVTQIDSVNNKCGGNTQNKWGQVQTFGNHQGRLKTHLTPSSPKLKVTYVFCLTPQTLIWQLPGVAAITREAWAPCHCVGCWSPFLGMDLFDGSWTTACSSENLGFNSSTSIN